jgi:hypothetical protein
MNDDKPKPAQAPSPKPDPPPPPPIQVDPQIQGECTKARRNHDTGAGKKK